MKFIEKYNPQLQFDPIVSCTNCAGALPAELLGNPKLKSQLRKTVHLTDVGENGSGSRQTRR